MTSCVVVKDTTLTIDPGKQTEFTAMKFPYQLDSFQLHGCQSIHDNHHVIVTAHTGSGKTSVGEYAIAYHIAQNHRVIYTTPIKALSNQIHQGLTEKHPDWDVGIKTGDIEINPHAQVVVMTTEILRNALFNLNLENDIGNLMEHVGCVIFDEIHWIKDRDRGHVWEESIISMPREIQMIGLSATIPDADQFANWLATTKNATVSLIPTTHRVVPLNHHIMTRNKLVPIMDNLGHFNIEKVKMAQSDFNFRPSDLNHYLTRLQKDGLLPAFFFCFSRDKCERYAAGITLNLVEGKESVEIGKMFDRFLSKFGTRYGGMAQVSQVKSLLMKGVCFHHSGLMHVLKEIIEIIFSKGLIKVLFVTETFAAGVNMPARTVVFTGLQKYDGFKGGLRALKPEEYSQMAGRAGRRGLDDKGTVILLPFHRNERLDPEYLKPILNGRMDTIHSQFKVDYSFVLKVIFNNYRESPETATDLISYAQQTMLNRQAISYIKQLENERDELQVQISELKPFDKSDPDYELLSTFYKYTYQANQLGLSRNKIGKALRSVKNRINKMDRRESKQFHDKIDTQRQYEKINSELAALNADIEYQKNYLKYAIQRIIEFLQHMGYLKELESDIDTFIYFHDQLTLKGLVAANINDCDPILFTEMLLSKDLDLQSYETAEIIALMAMFVDEKEKDREYRVTPTVKYAMKTVNHKIIRELMIVANKFNLTEFNIVPDWELSQEYVDLTLIWAQDGTIREIYDTSSDIYEGNFVKNILKVRNICENVIKSCEVTNNDILAKKLENYQEILVKSIVSPESLYLQIS